MTYLPADKRQALTHRLIRFLEVGWAISLCLSEVGWVCTISQCLAEVGYGTFSYALSLYINIVIIIIVH